MAARRLNRESVDSSELVLAQGPMPTSRLRSEVRDEAALLDGYEAHLRLLENRPKTTADTYRSHLKGFLRYMAINYPSVTLSGVTPFHVRAWLLHEATRGIEAITRSNDLFAAAQLLSLPHRRGSERGEPRLLGDPPESHPAAGRVLQ